MHTMEEHVSLVQRCPYGFILNVEVKQYNIFMAKDKVVLRHGRSCCI